MTETLKPDLVETGAVEETKPPAERPDALGRVTFRIWRGDSNGGGKLSLMPTSWKSAVESEEFVFETERKLFSLVSIELGEAPYLKRQRVQLFSHFLDFCFVLLRVFQQAPQAPGKVEEISPQGSPHRLQLGQHGARFLLQPVNLSLVPFHLFSGPVHGRHKLLQKYPQSGGLFFRYFKCGRLDCHVVSVPCFAGDASANRGPSASTLQRFDAATPPP